MKTYLFPLFVLLGACAGGSLHAAAVCPSTSNTTTDCDYVIDISKTGSVSVTQVLGSTAFNSAVTFADGTSDPGNDASLVGVQNDFSSYLTSLTLQGSDGSSGIFDFSNNGICVYTQAPYCGTAASGYEGPATNFSNLRSTVLFETDLGTVNFGPSLAPGQSTYFSLEDSAANLNANGGLKIVSETFATPEPGPLGLLVAGLVLLVFARLKFRVSQ